MLSAHGQLEYRLYQMSQADQHVETLGLEQLGGASCSEFSILSFRNQIGAPEMSNPNYVKLKSIQQMIRLLRAEILFEQPNPESGDRFNKGPRYLEAVVYCSDITQDEFRPRI
jgi:hypothetical protein